MRFGTSCHASPVSRGNCVVLRFAWRHVNHLWVAALGVKCWAFIFSAILAEHTLPLEIVRPLCPDWADLTRNSDLRLLLGADHHHFCLVWLGHPFQAFGVGSAF